MEGEGSWFHVARVFKASKGAAPPGHGPQAVCLVGSVGCSPDVAVFHYIVVHEYIFYTTYAICNMQYNIPRYRSVHLFEMRVIQATSWRDSFEGHQGQLPEITWNDAWLSFWCLEMPDWTSGGLAVWIGWRVPGEEESEKRGCRFGIEVCLRFWPIRTTNQRSVCLKKIWMFGQLFSMNVSGHGLDHEVCNSSTGITRKCNL